MAAPVPVVILEWLKEQWRKMAEHLDDFICSFDPPVPEGMDPLTVLLFGWLVFSCVLAVLLHLWKVSRNSKQEAAPAVSVTDFSTNDAPVVAHLGHDGVNSVKRHNVPNQSVGGKSAVDSVDDTFISRVQSSVPFKQAVAHQVRSQSESPAKLLKIPPVPGAPVASGQDEDCVLWVNNVINWVYGKAEVRNSIAQAWLAALNSHASKLAKETGINLHFVDIRPDTERPEFSNVVVVDTGPNDNMTIAADMSAQPRLTTRVTYEQDGQSRSATYDTRVNLLQGRLNVAALTHRKMAVAKFAGEPEVQLQLSRVDDRGISSSLEEQIRQEGAREVVTGCLRGAVADLNFSQEADFPPLQRRYRPDVVRNLPQDQSEGGGERITRRLMVKVIKAAGLGANKGCVEPYCVVEMDEPWQKFQTGSRAGTDHPFWDETFLFDLSANTSELLFEVFDSARPRESSFLGLGIVGIEELLVTPSQRQIIPLLPRPYEEDPVSGSLTLEFLFVDEDGTPVEEGMLPHRITHISERRLNSGQVLHTTRTTYTRPDDDDGTFVKGVVLKDVDSNARRNAKKSTLIIHSSKKEAVDMPAVKDTVDDAAVSDPGSDTQEQARGGSLHASTDGEFGRGRTRAKRRSFFNSLRKRMGGSKSRSKSTESGPQDWEEGGARSASLDRGHYLTVPTTGHGGRAGGPDDSSLSDMSGISNASNRTYVNDESTLVLETTENGVLKHFLVPNTVAKRGKWRRKGTKLHIYNEHVFVARHLPGALCSVCEKTLPRWLGKQSYECRNCHAKVHKQCHVRVETVCPDSTVHTMNMEYLQTLEDKRQRNMTR